MPEKLDLAGGQFTFLLCFMRQLWCKTGAKQVEPVDGVDVR